MQRGARPGRLTSLPLAATWRQQQQHRQASFVTPRLASSAWPSARPSATDATAEQRSVRLAGRRAARQAEWERAAVAVAAARLRHSASLQGQSNGNRAATLSQCAHCGRRGHAQGPGVAWHRTSSTSKRCARHDGQWQAGLVARLLGHWIGSGAQSGATGAE